jgi:hydroxyacylglutathione hydrolase
MLASLDRLNCLPDATAMYCGHEYTVANLHFALTVEPDNHAARERLLRAQALRSSNLPTLPSTLIEERAINPFLRCREPTVRRAAEQRSGRPLSAAEEVFAVVRQWKDGFRPPEHLT